MDVAVHTMPSCATSSPSCPGWDSNPCYSRYRACRRLSACAATCTCSESHAPRVTSGDTPGRAGREHRASAENGLGDDCEGSFNSPQQRMWKAEPQALAPSPSLRQRFGLSGLEV